MNATTVAVDVAKNVFALAVAGPHGKIHERHRLTRGQFERWFANRTVGLVVMEACASAHHWARWLGAFGIDVRLLPPRYVRPYVKRNKTDAADAAALLAVLILPQCASSRSSSRRCRACIESARGGWPPAPRESMPCAASAANSVSRSPPGPRIGVEEIARLLADPCKSIPPLLRATVPLLIEEIRLLEARIAQLETQLTAAARYSPACTTLLSVPGIGLLTATAMVAAAGGTVAHFKSARHLMRRGANAVRSPLDR